MSGFNKYCGVYPVVPTPLKEDESLDLAGLEHLVEYYIIEGCHGLLILGSGGESPYFSLDEKCSVVQTVAQKVKNRIPVIVGCTFFSLAEILFFMQKVDTLDSSRRRAVPPWRGWPLNRVVQASFPRAVPSNCRWPWCTEARLSGWESWP